MPGRESHTGLAVERVGPCRYTVLRVLGGQAKSKADLRIPDSRCAPKIEPVVVGDTVVWLDDSLAKTFTEVEDDAGIGQRRVDDAPSGWKFAKLLPSGLSRPMVQPFDALGLDSCRAGATWIVELYSPSSHRMLFHTNGNWSKPIRGELPFRGAGPAEMGLVCREGVGINTVADEEDYHVRVEECQCTARGCETRSAGWEEPLPPKTFVLLANLGNRDGVEKTVLAWHDETGALHVRSASLPALATATEQKFCVTSKMRFAAERYARSEDVIVRDGVSLIAFSYRGLHLLRIDIEGHVGPVDVDADGPKLLLHLVGRARSL
jgi:hypothetical protein